MRWFASLGLLLQLALVAPHSESLVISRGFDPMDSLDMQLLLEDSSFVVGQEIPVLLCVTNKSGRTLHGVLPPTYLCGHTDFLLRNLTTGKRVPRIVFSCGFFGQAYELPPGSSLCHVEILHSHFGSGWSNLGAQPSFADAKPGLPVGRYALSVHYLVHAPYDARFPLTWIATRPIEFRVDSLESRPKEIALIADFSQEGPLPHVATEDVRDRCVRWLPRFYESAYFQEIYGRARYRNPYPPVDSLFQDLTALRTRPFQRALLVHRFLTSQAGEHSSPPVLDSLRHFVAATPGPEILSSHGEKTLVGIPLASPERRERNGRKRGR